MFEFEIFFSSKSNNIFEEKKIRATLTFSYLSIYKQEQDHSCFSKNKAKLVESDRSKIVAGSIKIKFR